LIKELKTQGDEAQSQKREIGEHFQVYLEGWKVRPKKLEITYNDIYKEGSSSELKIFHIGT
jgi:hypothetical protein